jgi:hypothetical protein
MPSLPAGTFTALSRNRADAGIWFRRRLQTSQLAPGIIYWRARISGPGWRAYFATCSSQHSGAGGKPSTLTMPQPRSSVAVVDRTNGWNCWSCVAACSAYRHKHAPRAGADIGYRPILRGSVGGNRGCCRRTLKCAGCFAPERNSLLSGCSARRPRSRTTIDPPETFGQSRIACPLPQSANSTRLNYEHFRYFSDQLAWVTKKIRFWWCIPTRGKPWLKAPNLPRKAQ